MKKDNKSSEVKKGLATGAGVAVGAVAGAFVGASAAERAQSVDVETPNPDEVEEVEVVEVEATQAAPAPQRQYTQPSHQEVAQPVQQESVQQESVQQESVQQEPVQQEPVQQEQPVEVIGEEPVVIIDEHPGENSIEQPVDVVEQPVEQPGEVAQDNHVTVMDTEVEVISYDRVETAGGQMDVAVVEDQSGQQVAFIDVDLDSQADVAWIDHNEDAQITDDELYDVQEQNVDMHPMMDAANFSSEYAENEIPDYVNDADVDGYMA